MGIIDAWNDGTAAEIEGFGGWTTEDEHLCGVAGGKDAVAPDCQSLHIWVGGVAGKDLAVVEDDVGR